MPSREPEIIGVYGEMENWAWEPRDGTRYSLLVAKAPGMAEPGGTLGAIGPEGGFLVIYANNGKAHLFTADADLHYSYVAEKLDLPQMPSQYQITRALGIITGRRTLGLDTLAKTLMDAHYNPECVAKEHGGQAE